MVLLLAFLLFLLLVICRFPISYWIFIFSLSKLSLKLVAQLVGKGDTHKDTRKQLLEQASAIYQAESATQARTRLALFADTWRAQAPKAVAALQRDFELTIAYDQLEGVARELVRTTSLL